MKAKTNTQRKKILLAVFLMAVVLGLGGIKIQNASAATCTCSGGLKSDKALDEPDATSCRNACAQAGGTGLGAYLNYSFNGGPANYIFNNGTVSGAPQQVAPDLCPGFSGLGWLNPEKWFNCILLIVMRFMGVLITLAATLLNAVLDPTLFNSIMQNSALYTAWADVRDILNVAFIMVLLFSAFCTIFQIDKYNYKKILLTLVIMALLVNFSWPIARFIIDLANVLMYYFINTFGLSQGSIWTSFTNQSMLGHIIAPSSGVGSDTSFLLASVIFLFIFAATLLIIGILLVVRIIVLAILVIFSSIAFVGSIVPGLSSYSGKWWDNLFKYAFFGPIMAFMIAVSLAMMTNMQAVQQQFNTASSSQAGWLGPTIGAFAFFSIPVIILWVGLGFAQSMSIYGAQGARKFGMGAMNKVTGVNFAKSQWGAFSKARKARRDAIENNRFGGTFGRWVNRKQDNIVSVVSPGARKRADEAEKKDVQDLRKKWKDNGGASDAELEKTLNSRNAAKRKAAAMEMAEKNGFGDGTNPAADLARYQKALKAIEKDPAYKNFFNDKVKEKHIRLVIDHEMTAAGGGKTAAAAYQDNLDKMNADQLSKQKNLFDRPAFYTNFMNNKYATDRRFVVETAKKVNSKVRSDWRAGTYGTPYTI